ncbi:hypothetical protein B0T26DRAFT_745588 [Lasiosphaeria miniovina]|uniref:Uncharacterized protein n=1 Tax=Lasiosphaeria miniovina TaxID=1954250 RepID=A0AA40BGK1_9PEZI|nr:uncharacterized protein B0T26DRAFT_745588 [Lasiosphaeria miniovina]KAK0733553.1 hypothetical protein B0T26DRAFT_745588 [Lasiosphaeria miniovina]
MGSVSNSLPTLANFSLNISSIAGTSSTRIISIAGTSSIAGTTSIAGVGFGTRNSSIAGTSSIACISSRTSLILTGTVFGTRTSIVTHVGISSKLIKTTNGSRIGTGGKMSSRAAFLNRTACITRAAFSAWSNSAVEMSCAARTYSGARINFGTRDMSWAGAGVGANVDGRIAIIEIDAIVGFIVGIGARSDPSARIRTRVESSAIKFNCHRVVGIVTASGIIMTTRVIDERVTELGVVWYSTEYLTWLANLNRSMKSLTGSANITSLSDSNNEKHPASCVVRNRMTSYLKNPTYFIF